MAEEEIINEDGVRIVMQPTRAEFIAAMNAARSESLKKNFKAAIFLDQWVQRNFMTQGRLAETSGWKPFSPNNRRKQQDPNAKLLQDTGLLRASFKPFAEKLTAGIGSELPYSRKHDEGDGITPRRKILPTFNQVWPDIKRIWEGRVVSAFRRAFERFRRSR